MTIYSFILIIGGIILFLAGMPIVATIGILILVNLVVIIEDALTGGRLFQKFVKETKKEPIVIHDVIIENYGKDNSIKWDTKELNNSNHSYLPGTNHTGQDTR